MKRISRRNFLKAMGISTTALALAACGGSSSSTAAGTAGSSAASAAATGEPKAGGTLRLCYGNPIATPGYTPRATGNALLFSVIRGLCRKLGNCKKCYIVMQ